ncbi:MAG: LamG-like jellyroll fold domain-containing protein [Luteolibacter sp.]|uniref:LamG-like jellyroll fold domain-containing protein n=1 Tax=Luteolibacter sp. TaxID=1962973 RepID=UPI003264DFBB
MKKNLTLILGAFLTLPASAGVYAHYSFDTDYTDSSGNTNNGTLTDVGTVGNSGITTTPGAFKFGGGAMNFSPEKDYIAIPSKTFSSGAAAAYSFAFWAKKAPGDTGEAAQFDMVVGQRATNTFFISLTNNTGGSTNRYGLLWRSNSTTAADRQGIFTTTDDTAWHHYAVVASGTTVTLYVDGVSAGTVTGKQVGFTFDTIGEAYLAANDFDFNGQIDEMWIFDEALTEAKVTSLYNNNDPNSTFSGLHQSYNGNFSDSSGAGHNGTAAGGAAITTDPAAIASGSGALALDGEDGSYVSLTTGNPYGYGATNPWSVGWWARRQDIGTDKGMVLGVAGTTTDFIWMNDTFTGLRFRSSANTNFEFTIPKDTDLRHYALVADGAGNLKLYLNGQFSEQISGNTSFAFDTIGKAYPTSSLHYNFKGSLDEVHIYNSRLSDIQVQTLYDSEKPGSTTPAITKLRVYLLGGQSNADGRADPSALPTAPVNLQAPQADVDFVYKVEGGTVTRTTLRPGLTETSQFGPEVTLGRTLANQWSGVAGTRVAIIKYANGGTTQAVDWKGGGTATTTGDGPEYTTFQQTVTQGLAMLASAYPGATIKLEGMAWLQGESDAVASYASGYQSNLTTFITDIRATYGAELPFIICRLSSGQTNLNATYLSQVRAAQDAVATADRRTGIFSTEGFGLNGDDLHFNASAQQKIGSEFGDEAVYYQWMSQTFTATEINNGVAEPDEDADGDGQSNHREFLSTTDPHSGTSAFRATSSTASGSNTLQISYATTTTRTYSVEHLVEAGMTWETIVPAEVGTGGVVTKDITKTAARGIYRVRCGMP